MLLSYFCQSRSGSSETFGSAFFGVVQIDIFMRRGLPEPVWGFTFSEKMCFFGGNTSTQPMKTNG